MYAKERALEQANLFVTMVLVLLLMAGILVVSLTAALSPESVSFTTNEPSAPSPSLLPSSTSSAYTDADMQLILII